MELTTFDPSPILRDDEGARGYLEEAFATDDPTFILACIGDIARARGLDGPSAKGGLPGVMKALAALGIRLQPVPAPHAA